MTLTKGRTGIVIFELALALLISLWFFFANGGATFYFDSVFYIDRGHQILSLIGLDLSPLRDAGPLQVDPPLEIAANEAANEKVETVNGTRSMVFSLLMGFFFWLGAVDGLVLVNAATGVGLIWIACRLALRDFETAPRPSTVTLVAVGIAAFGSMPFYVGFLMPDMFTALLLLIAAVLAAFASKMHIWELLIVTAIGCLAITVSVANLAIGLILVVVVFCKSLFIREPRRWLGFALMLVVVSVGIGEQVVLRVAAKKVENAEVVFRPFLTARLVQDGPGYSYLEDYCPDDAEPTCALFAALSISDDPTRFSATNISFSKNPENGSYKLMTMHDQRRVAQQQFQFFWDVLFDRPVETSLAVMNNWYRQLTLNSVDMTLQTDSILETSNGMKGMGWGDFGHGKLTADVTWLGFANTAQSILYGLSIMSILGLLIFGRLPTSVAAFLILVLVGVLANAFVCGVLSQPANRYGARVVWLLPVSLAIAFAVHACGQKVKTRRDRDHSHQKSIQ